MIVKKANCNIGEAEACLKIEQKQKMQGQASRIFLNLVQVDSGTHEKTERYLADFDIDKKKDVLSWLMEPCRRRALQNTDTLKIDRNLMLDGYRDLFPHVVLI